MTVLRNVWSDAARQAAIEARKARKGEDAQAGASMSDKNKTAAKTDALKKGAATFWKGKRDRENRSGVKTKKGEITHVKTKDGKWIPVPLGKSGKDAIADHEKDMVSKAMSKAAGPAHKATGGTGTPVAHPSSSHPSPTQPKSSPSKGSGTGAKSPGFKKASMPAKGTPHRDGGGYGTGDYLHEGGGLKYEGFNKKDPKKGTTNMTTNRQALKGFKHNQHSMLRMNMGGTKIRHELLHNRDHLVVPMVMMVEGVHNGSAGPLFYPKAELSKNPDQWNHMPIVVYHPESNGKGVSARDPDVLNTRGVGVVLNTGWDDKLKSEAWLDVERTKIVDNRILDTLESGKSMEVSTGVFTDNEEERGEWQGEKYIAIARNHRPDHLAILPDIKGACSIADGAGLNRNAAAMPNHTHEHKRGLLAKALKGAGGTSYGPWPEDMTGDRVFYTDKDGHLVHEGYEIDDKGHKATLKGDAKKVTRKVQYVGEEGKVVANADDWRLDEINANDDQEVGSGELIRNGNPKEKVTMNKTQLIAALLANAAGLWTEADKPYLETLNEDRLQLFHDGLPEVEEVENKEMSVGEGQEIEQDGVNTGLKGKGKVKPIKKKIDDEEGVCTQASKKKLPPFLQKKKDEADDEDEDDAEKSTKNAEQSVDEYVANAPPEIREVLRHGVSVHNTQRAKLIKAITSNVNNLYTKQMLNAKGLDELQAIAALASPTSRKPTANFGGLGWGESGAGGGFPSATEAPLDMPTMNFEKRP